ncbi:MAG: ATP-dependent DNA helicase RecG, partial [Mycobacterium sp.]|nr:ATP-dependent DNA helicase RecG [Mycobacterium sp.]
MVALSDRLDYVLGASSADPLDEVFGIRTVDGLLRHYPRSYVEGAMVRGAGHERPPAGEHVTLVDTITGAELKPMKKRPNEKFLVITIGSGRSKVTATFFHPKEWIRKQLSKGARIMLSGEVGYFRGVMQLTHPDFLILNSPDGKDHGSTSLREIAGASRAVSGELLQSAFERAFFPIYPASAKVQSWSIYSCVRQVLAVLDPIPEPLPDAVVAEQGLISEDQALRAIHLSEDESERRRARERLTFDEAVGLQWALVTRRHGELSESGPEAPPRSDGLAQELLRRLPFELTAGQRDVLDTLAREINATRPMNRLLQGEVGSGKTIVA